MSHPTRVRVIVLATLCVLACAGNPTWQQHQSTNHPRKNVMIQFTDATLHPTTAQITADGNVAWINYASGRAGSVVFDASVRDAFPCDMRPDFMEVAAGYQSIPITGDGESVTLPCTPKPGVYEYELQLSGGLAMDPASGMGDPLSVMHGKIKVGP